MDKVNLNSMLINVSALNHDKLSKKKDPLKSIVPNNIRNILSTMIKTTLTLSIKKLL